MSGVRRYCKENGLMIRNDDGPWIPIGDHEAEIARLRAEVEKVRGYEVAPLEAKVAELRAEFDALRVYAERYRWLRDLPEDHPCEEIGNMPGYMWDEMIDAAMKEQAR